MLFREENDFQKGLAASLSDVHRHSEIPCFVCINQLVLPENFGRLCFIFRHVYWSRELHLEVRARHSQNSIAGGHTIEPISIHVYNRANCY